MMSKQARRDLSDMRAPSSLESQSFSHEPYWRLIPKLENTSSNVITVLNEEGVIRYQSDPVQWLLGYHADDMVNRRLESFLHVRSQQVATEALQRMIDDVDAFDLWRFRFRRASDSYCWLEGMASNFLRDPRLGGIVVYWRELRS